MAGNNRGEMDKKGQKAQNTHAEAMTNGFTLSGALLETQDVPGTVLEKLDAAALCQLKAASKAWRAHARRELCNRIGVRLSRREGQPEPAGVNSITDLDVECLNETGRPWEVVFAGRQLPQLARLHGYGFEVDLQAVQKAVQKAYPPVLLEEDDDDDEGGDEEPLGGDTLRSCIQGDGQSPNKLLLAAVACAASGTVQGVPVQWLREEGSNAIGRLNIRGAYETGRMRTTGATLLAFMLPVATSVHSLECATNPNPNSP